MVPPTMTGSSPRSSCQTSFLHLLKSQYLCSGRPVRQNRLVGSKYQKSIYLSVSSAVEQDRNREKKSLVVSTIFQPKEVSMFAMTKWKFFAVVVEALIYSLIELCPRYVCQYKRILSWKLQRSSPFWSEIVYSRVWNRDLGSWMTGSVDLILACGWK